MYRFNNLSVIFAIWNLSPDEFIGCFWLFSEINHCRLEYDLTFLECNAKNEWGNMKLGPIVYEKKGKSKSNNGPFVGTIRLKVPGTYKQSWKLLKMKNGHHFLV